MTAGLLHADTDHGEPSLILVVDGDHTSAQTLTRWLTEAGFRTASIRGPEALRAALSTSLPDLVLLDLGQPATLREIRSRNRDVPVVVLSNGRESSTIAAAMAEGAYDFLTQPVDRTKLLTTSRNACRCHRLSIEVSALERQTRDAGFDGLLGRSPQMRQLFRQMNKAAPCDISVLIHGESGTGKHKVAQALHRASTRAQGPYVAVNCGAIPSSLQESELFGLDAGAFAGAHDARPGRLERADGGTLFLDEIGELTPETQARLVQVLQEGRVVRVGSSTVRSADFRLLAASQRDLRTMVERGQLREDLYARIGGFELTVPALRDREGDLELLVERLLEGAVPKGAEVPRIDRHALGMLLDHRWPGNVRELSNVIRRAAIACEDGCIRAQDLPASLRRRPQPAANGAPRTAPTSLPRLQASGTLADLERAAIERELERCNGNVTAVGKNLGIGRTTLYRRLKQYGLR